MADQSVLKQIVEKVKDSSNVLVTVNTNPSVDELSAALGITLLINKLNKHATAVFSGAVPPAIEFLNPEKTFENTVDSLRDFIIALDKEKADHLRYKVVDDMVKIFITPYRTTIDDKDLEFSQGDYNVEVVLAVGVQTENDLDRALASHGRILHDATVAAISLGEPTKLGGIEWNDATASSYSELLYRLAEALKADKDVVDEQIATAFLTGIVAATNRFSNDKTTASAMTISAQLMAAGANQQLIATELQGDQAISGPEAPNGKVNSASGLENIPEDTAAEKPKDENSKDGAVGALSISHELRGDVDAVAKEISEKRSSEALSRAEEELTKHNSAQAAEQSLADQLKAVAPAAAPPSDLSDLLEPAPAAVPGAYHAQLESSQPSLGGTLNATTEQAADDKRRQIEKDKNRTILSHGGPYSPDTPLMQSPLNASVTPEAQEPEVRDIFADSTATTEPTGRAPTIDPLPASPFIESTMPTLAEIDAENRVNTHTDARAAVDAALNAPVEHPTQDSPLSAPMLPPLPPLPPMPDFSSLPPLPGEIPAAPSFPATVPDILGGVLPPAPEPQPVLPDDPAQFKIPSQ